jgi:putative ABC transport system permease protein
MIKDYLSISTRSLTKRKTRTYLTMIGIFIGIAAVVSLIGLGEGLRVAITSQFGLLGTDVLQIQASGLNFGPPGQAVPNPLSDELPEQISRIPNVDASFGRYVESVRMEYNDIQEITFIGSVPTGENREVFEEMVNIKASEGRLLKDGDGRRVVLGNDYSKEDNEFGEAIHVGDRVLINDEQFEVIGILEKKGSFIFDSGILMDDEVILDYIREDDGTIDVIAAKVEDESRIEATQNDIEKLLRKERDVEEGEEDFTVQSSEQALEGLNSTLFAVQLFIGIIAGISIVVGGIGIMNTMYTSVLERTKEIGIMKSIGAKNSTIFTLFFIESGLLGLIGGIIGVILGLIFAYGLAFLGRLALGSELIQANVSPLLIIGALAFSYLLGTIFGVLPAYQASKANPVESLRRAK